MQVLLADHQIRNRIVLKQLLEHEPELTVVGEAIEARDLLTQVQGAPPGLVLLDWTLPGMKGADLLRAIRRLGCFPKVVVYSERAEARREAFAAGADAFVSREEPPEWLLGALRSVSGLSPCTVG
jgi:two-component system invasion response regulator UvrY